MGILSFSDILRKVNIDPAKVKLIRHALTDKGFKECYDKRMVYEYTCHQRSGFSGGYDYWAVFISDAGTMAKFYALYKVKGAVPDTTDRIPSRNAKPEAIMAKALCFSYSMWMSSRNMKRSSQLTGANQHGCGIRKAARKSRLFQSSLTRKRCSLDMKTWCFPIKN